MTVSIVAADVAAGLVGVGTASRAFAVGAGVPFLRSGVGAAAVQAHAPRAWGTLVLDALAAGVPAAAVLGLLGSLPEAAQAQVLLVAADGTTGVLSGPGLEPEVSSAETTGACVAANLMERPGVAEAALGAYSASQESTLSGRMLDALEAADRMGGDLRGRQSATVRVVPAAAVRGRAATPTAAVDIRVDDAPTPLIELRRLHTLHRSYQHLSRSMNEAGLYSDMAEISAALRLTPDDDTVIAAAGLALARNGHLADAATFLTRLAEREPRTALRLRRLAATGRLNPATAQALIRAIEQR